MTPRATSLPPGPRLPGAAQAVLWGLRYPQFTRAGRTRFGATFTIKPGTIPPTVLFPTRDGERLAAMLPNARLERLRTYVGEGQPERLAQLVERFVGRRG